MSPRILIVEDEALVALEIEAIIEDLGLCAVGIAPDRHTALHLARENPDIAFVDLHLRDGLTGPDLGRELAEQGVSVVFLTANPRLVAKGVPGAYGVIEKPTEETLIADAIAYAMQRRGGLHATPPANLIAF
jgi:CheY-like chemotaxis protein